MNEGDVVLAPFPQADGMVKNRPAVILRVMRPYGDFLVCGVSRQLRQRVENFDEIITPGDADFKSSHLLDTSLIRLGFLALLPPGEFLGDIGSISTERHHRLLRRLAEYLSEPARKK
jgi:mRNA interferase MazF